MANEILGHGNCPRIQPISTYGMAKSHYESVIPIRGRAVETKPLGKERRYTWYTIEKRTYANQAENTEYNSYACHLYNTDCVEFYPNGDVTLRTGGWNSYTTGAMINFVLWHQGRLVSESGKWYFVNKRGDTYRFQGHELRLKYDGEFLVNKDAPVQEYKRAVSRKSMNKYRKLYKSFTDYGRTMLAMSNEIKMQNINHEVLNAKLGFDGKNVVPYHNWAQPQAKSNRNKFFAMLDEQLVSGDVELLYDLATYVARGVGRYSYQRESYICEPQYFLDRFTEMLKFEYRDEVFKSEPVPLGKMFNDVNKKYFA